MKYGEPYGGELGTVHSFAAYPDFSHDFGHQDFYHPAPMHAQNPHAMLQHDFEVMSNDHVAPDYHHDSQYDHHMTYASKQAPFAMFDREIAQHKEHQDTHKDVEWLQH